LVRREFIEFLAQREEPITLQEEHPDHLVVLRPDGRTVQMYLQRVYQAVQDLSDATTADRQQTYAQLAEPLLEDVVGRELTLERDGARLLPRIVNLPTLDQLGQLEPVPHRPLNGTDLFVVYVLDGEHSVAFLTESLRQQLQIDSEQLHHLALQNLAKTGGLDDVVAALEPGALIHVMVGDSYDAARVLLLPGMLQEGQQLAVAIPDRDTLGILLVDNPDAWRAVGELAQMPASDRLIHDQPLSVTCQGITAGPIFPPPEADEPMSSDES